MIVIVFFLGFLAGATAASVVTGTWLERHQANHFAAMLEQIRTLGPRG